MNQPQKAITFNDVINICGQTIATIQTVMKKDPKLITQAEFSNCLEGLRAMSSLIPDLYHILKTIEAKQSVKIVSGLSY